MVPHISPSKTWEGFGGALGFSLLASYMGCARCMPAKARPVEPGYDVVILGLGS